MSRFQFVADHQDTFEVKRLCELVEVERSSFYAWKAATPARAAKAATDAELADQARRIHAADNTVGAPRMTAELNDGVPPDQRVNHKRVARVMREHGIVDYRRRRRFQTTIPEPGEQKVPDMLGRDFTAQGRTSATSGTSPTCRSPAPTRCWSRAVSLRVRGNSASLTRPRIPPPWGG